MTCIELHLNADFYNNHPIFTAMVEKQTVVNIESALKVCVCDKSFNSLDNCFMRSWSSFLSILALSLVIWRPIQSLYPDNGIEKYKMFF